MKITWCKFEKVELWQQWAEQIIFLSDFDSDYGYDKRSWKSDSDEGKDTNLNRKKPYLSGQLYVKN